MTMVSDTQPMPRVDDAVARRERECAAARARYEAVRQSKPNRRYDGRHAAAVDGAA